MTSDLGVLTILTNGTAGQLLTIGTGGTPEWATLSAGSIDHGGLTGLSDDDHTQYALLAGRAGGQALIGGTESGDDLTFQTTSSATKGSYLFSELSAGVAYIGSGGALLSETTLSLSRGGTGASLTDPGADRLPFWDDSAGAVKWLSLGSYLSISDTTINTTGLLSYYNHPGWALHSYHNPIAFRSASSPVTGAFVIALNGVNTWDIYLNIEGQTDGAQGWSAKAGGRPNTGAYYGWEAIISGYILGKSPYNKIRFGKNPSGVAVIILGDTTDVSYMGAIYVRDVYYYYHEMSPPNPATFTGTWVTDLAGYLIHTSSPVVGSSHTATWSVGFGSTTTPGYTFTYDPDTGIYRSAADVLGLVTGGAERMTIYSDGKVGISQTTPTRPLSFANSVGEKISLFANSAAARDYYGFAYETNILAAQMRTGGEFRLYADSSVVMASSAAETTLYSTNVNINCLTHAGTYELVRVDYDGYLSSTLELPSGLTVGGTTLHLAAHYATTITGNGSATSFTVTHSMGTRDVVVSLIDTTTGANQYYSVQTAWKADTTNTVVIYFNTAPATGTTYRVVVIGYK